MTLTPRPYQFVGRDFLAERRFALLADQMRVGKTPQAILAAHKVGAQSLLVTCPAIAVPHWHRELEKWWPSGPLPRHRIWSYDRAREQWKAGSSGTVDVFVPDECHFAKNPEAARTQMVYGKTGFSRLAGAVWPLSGTPAPKHAGELWPMLFAFGVVGMSYDEFLKRYCRLDWMSGRPVGTREEYIPELRALLAKVMLRRTRKEVAPDMPDIGFDFLEVEIGKGRPDLEDFGTASDEDVLAWVETHQNVDREDRIAVALAKVDPLVEEIVFAIENNLLKQTVVFGWHREPLSVMVGKLLERGIRAISIRGDTSALAREVIQREFRDGTQKIICANILAAGTAIDLSAASHAYFLELDWVPGNNVQAASRLVSMDKTEKVTADVVTWPGSVDDRIQKVLLRRVQELARLY